jgi:hypothetical protein
MSFRMPCHQKISLKSRYLFGTSRMNGVCRLMCFSKYLLSQVILIRYACSRVKPERTLIINAGMFNFFLTHLLLDSFYVQIICLHYLDLFLKSWCNFQGILPHRATEYPTELWQILLVDSVCQTWVLTKVAGPCISLSILSVSI